MLVTVNTDASFSQKHGIGTYAFWITSKYGRFKKYGVLKGKMPSALYAETKAIGNAVAFLYQKSGLYPYVSKIIINTDCEPAIHLLMHNHKADHKHSELRNRVKYQFQLKEGVKLEMRHVPAHNGTDTARKYVNEWCDIHAKKAMGKKLSQIKNQKS